MSVERAENKRKMPTQAFRDAMLDCFPPYYIPFTKHSNTHILRDREE